ncbi:DUF3331 domain-containing protein [Paraburkholderia sp. WSM4175]|uniref:DUF3331 domain-containing protein n=1 Tax=Paraburkholderia sp. WSM4175 TaxID=2991072 RepID=UPI003D21B784
MENAMSKHTYVSSRPDAAPSVLARGRNPSLSGSRYVATPANEYASRWLHITCSLGACSGDRNEAAQPARCSPRPSRAPALEVGCGLNATIDILDRPSAVSVVLSWRDPTSCNYGYQTWQKRVARRVGVCALSGLPIQSSDAIYRPGPCRRRPSNASAMILAVYIDSPQLAPRRPSRE